MIKLQHYLNGMWTLPLIMAPGCQSDYHVTKPNIVFILADDMGYGDLSCLNPDSRIQTGFMDQIAREGMIFTNAHSPSAVCTPTRYGILTGEYCFRTSLKSGVLGGYSPSLIDSARTTVAELLKSAGYQTACIGKWHLGLDWARRDTSLPLLTRDPLSRPVFSNVDYAAQIAGGPADHGFDYSYFIPASLDMPPYCYIRNRESVAPIEDTIVGNENPRGIFWRRGDIQKGFELETTLESLTHEAVGFISRQSDTQKPFFLYFPLTAPHTPWLPGKASQGKSGAGTYGDFVLQVDACIGRVLQALKSKNLDKNTILIVTSDNGSNWTPSDIEQWSHTSNGIFRGQKSDAWEGGHHVPFLIKWPKKIKPGQVSDQLICLTDLFATCSDLTGVEKKPSEGPDSFSFLPAALGTKPETPVRTSIVHHSIFGMFALTSGEWKLIDGKGSGGWSGTVNADDPSGQLYHIKTDITESKNLFLEKPDMVRGLMNQLNEIKTQSWTN